MESRIQMERLGKNIFRLLTHAQVECLKNQSVFVLSAPLLVSKRGAFNYICRSHLSDKWSEL